MKAHLVACASCGRHVRVSETTCPFCQTLLSSAFRATPAPRRVAARLSRAALFALGTGAATASFTAACSSDTPEDAQFNTADAYGGPPEGFDAHNDAPLAVDAAYGGPPQDVFVVDAAYGGPPPIDSGDDGDIDDAGDAGEQ